MRGDINGDGVVNLRDVTTLTRHFSENWKDTVIRRENSDVNSDNDVTLEDIAALKRWLLGDGTAAGRLPQDLAQYELLSASTGENGVSVLSFRYGTSVQGRDLACWCLSKGSWDRTVLVNLEIHGFEDAYAKDGQVLVDLGNQLVEHYSKQYDLHNCRLLVIPQCNPDGLIEGTTNNGFGRCNAEGIDLNRDFDASHIVYSDARNYTQSPFSAVESRAMRELVLSCRPSVVLDLHGWENCTIGSSAVAETFSLHTGLNHKKELTDSAHGYFSYWAQLQGAEALLVEFKDSSNVKQTQVCAALDDILAGNYGAHASQYPLDAAYAGFRDITAYAATSDRIYVQRQVGEEGTEYGWIDGANDKCTIRQIYDNGWCKVIYPAGNLFKTGFCKVESFIDTANQVAHYQSSVSADTPVYATSDQNKQIGSVWSTDTFTVIAEKGGMLQILYPLDAGGYKLGWIVK